MQTNIKGQLFRSQFNTPLYSPRTTFSNHLKEINSLKINMIINIDKYVLGSLKNQFEKRGRQISKLQFFYYCKKFLKDWNNQLFGRQVKIQECLLDIWNQIDLQSKGRITWEQFNSKIIETSLNLKSLSNNLGIQAPIFRQLNISLNPGKNDSPIAKLIYIKNKNKMAYFRQQGIQIDFFSTQPQIGQIVSNKPLFLPQQQLKVEMMMKVKTKNEPNQKVKLSTKTVRKDVKVSSYKNTVIDAIYLDDPKHDMLIVSCSDKYVRGYNVSNVNPVIAFQPQNQDQHMIHQFPVQIYNMAWDQVNQVLYATGKTPKIYQWLIKTDSEREMQDLKGHQEMISTLLMMPKLRLLASGGYDGKLILWDVVGQVIKCKYEQHTRAISSITFHQGLILLFTSSYDHKICIWNPYINSLIHKIDNSLNVICVEIIPNTNYLISLDCGGNVKVRQTNRFTQIAAFSIFRSQNGQQKEAVNKLNSGKDKQANATMCSKKDGNVQYYFGTDKITGYEYFQVEKSSIHGGTHLCMKYQSQNFCLYTPLKNHILEWNLLTGKATNIFYDMTQNDISALQLIEQLRCFVVGDVDGNIIQRKTSNGFFMKNLYKLKSPINNIQFHEVQRSQKQKTSKKTYLLFSTTEEGEIVVFKGYPKVDFQLYKVVSLRKDFNILNGSLLEIRYFGAKNIFIVSLSTNQVLFIDIEKRSLLVKLQLGQNNINSMSYIKNNQTDYFVILTKLSQLSGFYLPPHAKKFKVSCFLTIPDIQKVECSLYGQKSQSYFISTQQNQLICLKFNEKILEAQNLKIQNDNNSDFKIIWKVKIENKVKKMLLIQKQEILILLNQSQDFTFIYVQNGEAICNLRQQVKNESTILKQNQPILYFKQKSHQIFIPNDQKVIQILEDQIQQHKVHISLDPNFFIKFLKQKNLKNFSKTSNPNWPLNLNFKEMFQKRIKNINQIEQSVKNKQNFFDKNGSSEIERKLQKAIQLQKKWERQKQTDINQSPKNNQPIKNNTVQKVTNLKEDKNAFVFDQKLTRGASLGSLWKRRQNLKKTQKSVHADRANNDELFTLGNSRNKINQIEKLDFSKIKNDPLYRLGLALKKINSTDKKAQNFIQLARKKQQFKLPRISSQKIRL